MKALPSRVECLISWSLEYRSKLLSEANIKARIEASRQKLTFEKFRRKASPRAFSFATLINF
jgi:hypothetical protein